MTCSEPVRWRLLLCQRAAWIPVCTAVAISDCRDMSGLLWLDGMLLVPGEAMLAVGLSAGATDDV